MRAIQEEEFDRSEAKISAPPTDNLAGSWTTWTTGSGSTHRWAI